MANKQIYELTTRTFDGDSLLPISVENPDTSTSTEYPQLAGKTSGNALSDFVANDQQYATDLDTENKTITGAINELHGSIGADTYNTSSTYNKGDIVIYNGTLYACKDNSVTGTWNASHWDFWKNNFRRSRHKWTVRFSNSTLTVTRSDPSTSMQKQDSFWKSATSYSKTYLICNRENKALSACSSQNTRPSRLSKNKKTT